MLKGISIEFEFSNESITEPIEIRMIRPSKFPVRYADQKNSPEFESLKNSLREHGMLQPIIVRPLERGFEIVAGHRRFFACKSLRWRFIPCKIYDLSDQRAYEIQLSENIQRKSMDPIEEAEAYQKYVMRYGWGGTSQLAKRIGKSEEYVSHRMQLLKLSDLIKEKVASNSLSVSQAIEITTIDHPTKEEFVDEIVNNKLTVRQIRQMKQQFQSEEKTLPASKTSKSLRIVKRANLALKITLSRLDDLIEDAHKLPQKDRIDLIKFLMEIRQNTHTLIDETLKQKKLYSN